MFLSSSQRTNPRTKWVNIRDQLTFSICCGSLLSCVSGLAGASSPITRSVQIPLSNANFTAGLQANPGGDFVLLENISLNNRDWYYGSQGFSGSIEGRGRFIQDMRLSSAGAEAMFSTLDNARFSFLNFRNIHVTGHDAFFFAHGRSNNVQLERVNFFDIKIQGKDSSALNKPGGHASFFNECTDCQFSNLAFEGVTVEGGQGYTVPANGQATNGAGGRSGSNARHNTGYSSGDRNAADGGSGANGGNGGHGNNGRAGSSHGGNAAGLALRLVNPVITGLYTDWQVEGGLGGGGQAGQRGGNGGNGGRGGNGGNVGRALGRGYPGDGGDGGKGANGGNGGNGGNGSAGGDSAGLALYLVNPKITGLVSTGDIMSGKGGSGGAAGMGGNGGRAGEGGQGGHLTGYTGQLSTVGRGGNGGDGGNSGNNGRGGNGGGMGGVAGIAVNIEPGVDSFINSVLLHHRIEPGLPGEGGAKAGSPSAGSRGNAGVAGYCLDSCGGGSNPPLASAGRHGRTGNQGSAGAGFDVSRQKAGVIAVAKQGAYNLDLAWVLASGQHISRRPNHSLLTLSGGSRDQTGISYDSTYSRRSSKSGMPVVLDDSRFDDDFKGSRVYENWRTRSGKYILPRQTDRAIRSLLKLGFTPDLCNSFSCPGCSSFNATLPGSVSAVQSCRSGGEQWFVRNSDTGTLYRARLQDNAVVPFSQDCSVDELDDYTTVGQLVYIDSIGDETLSSDFHLIYQSDENGDYYYNKIDKSQMCNLNSLSSGSITLGRTRPDDFALCDSPSLVISGKLHQIVEGRLERLSLPSEASVALKKILPANNGQKHCNFVGIDREIHYRNGSNKNLVFYESHGASSYIIHYIDISDIDSEELQVHTVNYDESGHLFAVLADEGKLYLRGKDEQNTLDFVRGSYPESPDEFGDMLMVDNALSFMTRKGEVLKRLQFTRDGEWAGGEEARMPAGASVPPNALSDEIAQNQTSLLTEAGRIPWTFTESGSYTPDLPCIDDTCPTCFFVNDRPEGSERFSVPCGNDRILSFMDHPYYQKTYLSIRERDGVTLPYTDYCTVEQFNELEKGGVHLDNVVRLGTNWLAFIWQGAGGMTHLSRYHILENCRLEKNNDWIVSGVVNDYQLDGEGRLHLVIDEQPYMLGHDSPELQKVQLFNTPDARYQQVKFLKSENKVYYAGIDSSGHFYSGHNIVVLDYADLESGTAQYFTIEDTSFNPESWSILDFLHRDNQFYYLVKEGDKNILVKTAEKTGAKILGVIPEADSGQSAGWTGRILDDIQFDGENLYFMTIQGHPYMADNDQSGLQKIQTGNSTMVEYQKTKVMEAEGKVYFAGMENSEGYSVVLFEYIDRYHGVTQHFTLKDLSLNPESWNVLDFSYAQSGLVYFLVVNSTNLLLVVADPMSGTVRSVTVQQEVNATNTQPGSATLQWKESRLYIRAEDGKLIDAQP